MILVWGQLVEFSNVNQMAQSARVADILKKTKKDW